MRGERVVRWGSMAGLLGVLAFNILFAASLHLSPEWRFGLDFMSELGLPGPHAWLFNSALLVMGISGMLFALGLGQFLAQGSEPEAMGRWSIALLLSGCVCLALLGVFTMELRAVHDALAWGFFLLTSMALLLMIFPLTAARRMNDIIVAVTAGTVAVNASCLLLIWTKVLRQHLAELMVVYALGAWIFLASVLMLKGLRDRETVTPGTGS